MIVDEQIDDAVGGLLTLTEPPEVGGSTQEQTCVVQKGATKSASEMAGENAAALGLPWHQQ